MIKNIWDFVTDRLFFLPCHPQFFLKRYERCFIKEAKKYARGTLLDVGCGRMPYKKNLLPFVDEYLGLDHPETAKLYKGKEKPDIFADAVKMPLKNRSVQTVLLVSVLEHLPEPKEALKEIYRVLKRRGILILIAPQAYPLHDQPFDYYRFTRFGLKHLLENAGFKIIKNKSLGNFWINCGQQFNVYLLYGLKRIIKNPLGKLAALIFFPAIALLIIASNALSWLLSPLDRSKSFAIYNLVVAKKTK